MEHADHVALLRNGIAERGGVWADFGAGRGAFTLALAELLGPGAELFVSDRDGRALRENEAALTTRFPDTMTHYVTADFNEALELPPLDGLVMANSLHFQRDQAAVVALMRGRLREGGRMLVVEYNISRGNGAVPHPAPFERWERLALDAGFGEVRLLARRPSRFLHEIYSSVAS